MMCTGRPDVRAGAKIRSYSHQKIYMRARESGSVQKNRAREKLLKKRPDEKPSLQSKIKRKERINNDNGSHYYCYSGSEDRNRHCLAAAAVAGSSFVGSRCHRDCSDVDICRDRCCRTYHDFSNGCTWAREGPTFLGPS